MPVFEGIVKWIPPARGGSNRMGDLSAYHNELETLLRHTPNEAIQIAMEEHDRVATVKNRCRRALKELGRDDVALRFRNLYSPAQEERRKAGEQLQPEKLLVTYALAEDPATRRPGRRKGTP